MGKNLPKNWKEGIYWRDYISSANSLEKVGFFTVVLRNTEGAIAYYVIVKGTTQIGMDDAKAKGLAHLIRNVPQWAYRQKYVTQYIPFKKDKKVAITDHDNWEYIKLPDLTRVTVV